MLTFLYIFRRQKEKRMNPNSPLCSSPTPSYPDMGSAATAAPSSAFSFQLASRHCDYESKDDFYS